MYWFPTFTFGMLLGLVSGYGYGWFQSSRHGVQAASDDDMIRELKRRRFQRRLKEETSKEVETEIRGNPPSCKT